MNIENKSKTKNKNKKKKVNDIIQNKKENRNKIIKLKNLNKTEKSSKAKIQNKKQINKSKKKLKNISLLPTLGDKGLSLENEKKANLNNFNLISINLNLNKKYIPPESNIILNNYTFEEAVKYDKRQLCEIFYIFALAKQIHFHTFLFRSPIELFSLRFCLLLFITSSDLALNALFYFNDNISKKYKKSKNLFLFAFSDNITIIIISTTLGFILLTILSKLSNSTNAIREVFLKEEEKIKKDKKYKITQKTKTEILMQIDNILKRYRIKVIILLIIEFLLELFFWYFVTAFCHVYHATQISWIYDSLLSILSRAIIELLISFGLAKLYTIAITGETHCLYKVVMFLYNLG